MSNDVLSNQPVLGSIIVTSRNNSGTLQADRFPGTIGAENPLVAESAMIREKSGQCMRGKIEPSGLPCSCSNGGTYRRGAAPEAPCAVCGGTRSGA
jgi:hypothetical protein